jgi:hypothetical protein
LHQRGHRDHHELVDLREIVDEKMKVLKKMMMDGQSLGDPMMDGRSMVLMKMDAKMDDHLMVAQVDRYWIDRYQIDRYQIDRYQIDRYCVDALPLLTPICTNQF